MNRAPVIETHEHSGRFQRMLNAVCTIIRLPIAIIPCMPIDPDSPGPMSIVVPVVVISVVMPSVTISVVPSTIIISRG